MNTENQNSYILNEAEYNEFKEAIEQLYDIDVIKKESSDNQKLNKIVQRKPIILAVKGNFRIYLFSETNKGNLWLEYYNVEGFNSSLSIIDDETGIKYEINDLKAIAQFSYALEYYVNRYFNGTSFSNICSVFTGLNSSNIAKIEKISSTSGTPPMGLLPHEYYESKQSIDLLIDYYLNSTLCVASRNIAIMPGGSHVKMLIYTNYGSTYELDFYSGYLKYENNYYSITTNAFTIAPDRINYSFDVNSASGEVYEQDKKVGNYILDLSSLKLVHYDEDFEFEPSFYFEAQYATIEFTNNPHYIRMHNVVYKVEEGIDVIEKIIAFANGMDPVD